MFLTKLFRRNPTYSIHDRSVHKTVNHIIDGYNSRVANIRSKIDSITLPERFKGTVVEKWAQYWKDLYKDYYEVYSDVLKEGRERPYKMGLMLSTFGGIVYCSKKNPTEQNFRDAVVVGHNDVILVSKQIRNPACYEHLSFIESCYNTGLIRSFSFGIFRIVYLADYDKALGLYKAQCQYLQPQYLTMYNRILDIGFLDKWWFISKKMEDYDVNPEEWSTNKVIMV
ncbi:hypothetical protein LSTR_LSTR013913 [Laodelphax striatellus]|uniref:Mitochondrial import inner membrane translocase subunit Tim29 n=1 Tax=Laodelphax striatellus TaxID=195883 RepID=A0A482X591_LAOST|nr:hypothetical protein LSTR_LSTR013913 [Laodelphax striatellus]